MSERGKIEVWQDGEIWCARLKPAEGKSSRASHSRDRDDAIFWLGWWTGRRELGEAVKRHVEGGGGADEGCSHG